MSYELHILRAGADGVQPALLLGAPGKKAEYLFNVPDGFSRLALEQKLTPSARLSCILLTSLLPPSTGGFGGLFLRLRHDGHGQVQVIGPQGSSSIIHSLRHICRWQHPKVFVSECCGRRPIPVFEDEYIVIVPLVAGDQLTGCPWCLYAISESSTANPPKKGPLATSELRNNSSSGSDCSGSGSDTSSDDTASIGFVQSTSDRDGDTFEKSLREFNACSEIGKDFDTPCKSNNYTNNGDLVDRMSRVCHNERDGGDLKGVLLQQRKRDAADSQPLLDSDEETSGRVRDGQLLKAKKAKTLENSFGGSRDVKRFKAGATTSLSVQHHDDEGRVGLNKHARTSEDGNLLPSAKGNGMIDVAEVSPAGASGGEMLKSSYVQPTKPYERIISNLRESDVPQLADDCNPVYGFHPSTQAEEISRVEIEKTSKLNKTGGNDDSLDGNPARVLAYVAYLRMLKKAVLIVDCGSTKDLESLRRHPALSCIHCNSERNMDDATKISSKMHCLSATVHLTPQRLVQCCDYQLWMASLRSLAHVVMDESSFEFGFQSSLAMLQKLNSIEQDIFPLPLKMDPTSRTTHSTQELTHSNASIIDAGLSMCLVVSEEGTTLSHTSAEHSVHALSLNKISSIAESAKHVQPELLFAKAEVPSTNKGTCSLANPNLLAAIGMKRRLLEQKETVLSSGRSMHNRETLSNDDTSTTYPAKNTAIQDSVCRSCVLPLTTKENQGHSSGLSHSEDDDTFADGDRAFNADGELATLVVLKDKQAMASLIELSRNESDLISQTRSIRTPVQEYMEAHDPASDFQLVFLGTGSAEPSKKRGSSSILLQVRGAQGAMLLDAGEGAAGQLFRRFGEHAAGTIISSLQCLWLSHKHADHALGVLSILQTRSTQAAPLVIIGPHKVGQWLSEVRDTWSVRGYLVPQFTFIHCGELSKSSEEYKNRQQQHRKQLLEVFDAMQLNSMLSVKVFHCHDAHGIILNGRHGWTVVYSGDTRPCKQLIEAGQGCTLLIHEATFEDALVEQAKCKRHSTVSEAIRVGWEMRAQHIILTHFSQRYPEMVAMDGPINDNLSVAFDGMVVPSQLLGLLGKLLPKIRIACQKTVDAVPPVTDSKERSSECTSKPKLVVFHGESTLQQNFARESLVAKHKRWVSDSDDDKDPDDAAKGHNTDDHAINTLTWASGSDEEAESNEQGLSLLIRNGSRSSFEGIVNKSERIVDSSFVQRVSVERNSQLDDEPSSNTREIAGPLGGKHVRWIDSDSEDG